MSFSFHFLLQVQLQKEQVAASSEDVMDLFLLFGHVYGRQDLLQLQHLSTGKELRALNIEKIVVVPDGDPLTDIRPDAEQEQPLQNSTSSLQEHNVVLHPSNALSPDLNKVALSFGQYLSTLSKPQIKVMLPRLVK